MSAHGLQQRNLCGHHTLASWTFPAWERGRSSEAWRTKNTRMRPAMRSTSAPAKLALVLDGLGLNFDKYSTLHPASASQNRSSQIASLSRQKHTLLSCNLAGLSGIVIWHLHFGQSNPPPLSAQGFTDVSP